MTAAVRAARRARSAARFLFKKIVCVDLPRPRERTSEDFNTIRRRLAQAIQDEVLAAQHDWGSPA